MACCMVLLGWLTLKISSILSVIVSCICGFILINLNYLNFVHMKKDFTDRPLFATMDRLASLFANPIKPMQAKSEDVKTRYGVITSPIF